jgi:tRNA pseudouridine38-40 synthase
MRPERFPTRTLRLDLAYEGTRYSGFGIQPGRLTVQEVLEEALARSLGEQVRVTAAGRTDAGVHASGQVVSMVTAGRLRPAELVRAANAYLPEDILIESATEVPPDFDARRTAYRRHYRFLIWNNRVPNLWLRRWSWRVADRLDVTSMDEAALLLHGERDFASFAGGLAQEPAGRGTVRTVEQARWWRDGDLIGFEITANAFLRHMVRGIVGTLVQVGRGRLNSAQFETMIAAADRRQGGPNAPPHGLMLIGVEYPEKFEIEQEGRRAQLGGQRAMMSALFGTHGAAGAV